jgi:hypothetical protein
MKEWYSSIYKGFIIAGIIAFIIGFFSKGEVSIDSYIAGYSVLILGIMMILIIIFNNVLKIISGQSSVQILKAILFTSGPFLLILGVISFILYLMITYRSNIVNNNVSNGYYSFSNISVILLLIQLYIVYTNISTQKFEETSKFSNLTLSFVYLLGVLSAISSIILYTILKYYTTDGFVC